MIRRQAEKRSQVRVAGEFGDWSLIGFSIPLRASGNIFRLHYYSHDCYMGAR